MACLESTAPINISRSKIRDKCTNKCQYFHNYNNSKCTITNKKNHLMLSYDRPNDESPVTYNGEPFYTTKVMIFRPSIHSYDGSRADAEFIIEHRSNTGENMIVCIPIITREGLISKSSTMLDKMIRQAAFYAQNEGEKVTLNLNQYNLDNFVPQGRFYAYRGTYFMYPCNGSYNYTVFHKDDAYLTIPRKTLDKLKKTISYNYNSIKNSDNVNLYLNEKGPNSGVRPGDEIYIECKPTGTEGEKLQQQSKSESSEDQDYLNKIIWFIYSPYFLIPFMIFVFFVLYKIIKFVALKLKDKDFSKPISQAKKK